MNIPLTVFALRKDGFSNSIALFLKDGPDGFKLSGDRVPANQDQVRLTLSVPPVTRKEPFNLSLEGHAIVQGKGLWRPAVPADDMMQAFAYRHLVPAKEMKVAVAGRGMAKASVKLLGETPVKIPAGGTARVRIDLPARAFAGQFQLELSEPPEGITIKNVSPSGFASEIVLQSDATKIKPGLEGNLIVNAYAAKSDAAKTKGKANLRRAALGSLPAIPFEIVAQ
jgi:hypothetical protein